MFPVFALNILHTNVKVGVKLTVLAVVKEDKLVFSALTSRKKCQFLMSTEECNHCEFGTKRFFSHEGIFHVCHYYYFFYVS